MVRVILDAYTNSGSSDHPSDYAVFVALVIFFGPMIIINLIRRNR
jgi:hypothetical protein